MLTTVAIPYQVYQLTGSTLCRRPARNRSARPAADDLVSGRGDRGRARPAAPADRLRHRAGRHLGAPRRECGARATRASGRCTPRRRWAQPSTPSSGPPWTRSCRDSSARTRSLRPRPSRGSTRSFGHVGGPAIGGILIASAGLTATYAVDVVTFTASLVAAMLLPKMPPLGPVARPGAERNRGGLQVRPPEARAERDLRRRHDRDDLRHAERALPRVRRAVRRRERERSASSTRLPMRARSSQRCSRAG